MAPPEPETSTPDLRRAADTARLLVETARQLGESLDRDQLYDSFQRLLEGAVPHEGVVVSSYSADDDAIRCDYAWVEGNRLDPASLPPLKLNPAGEGMQSRVIISGESLLENDVGGRVARDTGGTYYDVDSEGKMRRVPDSGPPETQAAIMVPVKHEGAVVGVVQVMSDRQTYDAEDVELVEALVGQMSAAVRNAKLYEAAQAEIRARHAAEQELRASEARFRATFDNAAVGIAELGLDGGWLRVNDRLCEILGRGRDELVGSTLEALLSPAEAEATARRLERLASGDVDHDAFELELAVADGGLVSARVTASAIPGDDDRPARLVAVVEDVGERKRVEAERAASREREQAARVLQAVADGVVLADDAGVVRLVNPAAERILDRPAPELVGRPLDSIPGWRDLAARVRPGETGPSAVTALPLAVGDRELWLSVVAVRSTDGVVYAFRDETAERALDEVKSEFIATVSHELRTPLAAVYGAAATLLREDTDFSSQQRRALLEMIATQTARLGEIADEVLLASRLDSGSLPLASELIDLGAIAGETVAAMQSGMPPGLSLHFDERDDLPAAVGDADKLRQVLVNLIDNAVKYSPEGGSVTVAVAASAAVVSASVSDTGLGIPYEEQDRIFERFYRIDPHHAHVPGGTGLGLYISRELMRRMGGRLSVESEPERGSTFTVELPIA